MLYWLVSSAQTYQVTMISKKARYLYQQAQDAITQDNYTLAAGFLERAVKDDSGYLDAYAQLGSIYLSTHRYSIAAYNFTRALDIDSVYARSLLYSCAKALAGEGHFEKAVLEIDRYLQSSGLDSPERRNALVWLQHYQFALHTLNRATGFNPVNLGDSINTDMPEYAPSLTIDQKTLIFTRLLGGHNEDFYISHLDSDGKWSLAANIGPPVNTPYNEGSGHISQDGQFLLYAGCNFPGGFGSCDIYYSMHAQGRWTTPKNIGEPVNSPYWDTQPCLSADNKDLYFVSNRPGGYGGSDIYVSHLLADGHWGQPENLGPNINSAGDESSPFIHADNQTLFFASDGWPGIGDVDIFYSRRNPDGSWGKPVNLGYPINTIDHDGSLFVAADGKTAYFASDRTDGYGQLDLYSFTLYPKARPLRTLFVKGYVFDAVTGQRLASAIDLINLENGRTVTRIYCDQQGNYLVALPVGKNYAFHVTRPGYLFYSDNFSLKGKSPEKPYYINIGLQPIAVNDSMVLKNIFFDVDRYDLKPQSLTELDQIVLLMQQNPGVTIQINGYTDNAGTVPHNLALSRNRAQSVVSYLVSRGIPPARLKAKGFGDTHPVASNDTDQGRAQNRRTELVITGK